MTFSSLSFFIVVIRFQFIAMYHNQLLACETTKCPKWLLRGQEGITLHGCSFFVFTYQFVMYMFLISQKIFMIPV